MENEKHDRRGFLRVAGGSAAIAAAFGRGIAQAGPQTLSPAAAANSAQMEHYVAWMKSAYWITTTFRPAISVPAGFTPNGLPIGLQIVGRHRGDFSVLQMAYAFEQTTGFGNMRPSVA